MRVCCGWADDLAVGSGTGQVRGGRIGISGCECVFLCSFVPLFVLLFFVCCYCYCVWGVEASFGFSFFRGGAVQC